MTPIESPERIDRPGWPDRSRLICIYTVRGSLAAPDTDLQAVHEVLPRDRLGRFRDHLIELARADDLVPRIRRIELAQARAPVAVATAGRLVCEASDVELYVVGIPESGVVALLTFTADLSGVEEAVVALQETCFRKNVLRLDGDRLAFLIRRALPASCWKRREQPVLDRDVCQILVPGSGLRHELPAGERRAASPGDLVLRQLVYREVAAFRPGSGSVRYPAELNRPSGGFCGHARGVTVLSGAAEHVVWGAALTAAELLSASRRLRIVRERAVRALRDVRKITAGSRRPGATRRTRAELAAQSKRLGDLELSLSFGVEAYLESLRMPEVVLDSYRRSLAESLLLPDGIHTTSRMLSRFRLIIAAREAELDELRKGRTEAALNYVTVIAAPLALVLAFLGATLRQVDDSNASLFGFGRYWPYYAGLGGLLLLGILLYFDVWRTAAGAVRRLVRGRKDSASSG